MSSVLPSAKNFFRVSHRAGAQLHSHCFQASDAFNKQQWINCIRQAKEAAALTGDQPPQTGPEAGLSGQTGLSPWADSGHGNEEGVSGQPDKGQGSEVSLRGKEDLGVIDGLGLTQEVMIKTMEADLSLHGESGTDAEPQLLISETKTGVGVKGGVCGTGAASGASADIKVDEGQTLSRCDDAVHTSLLSSLSPNGQEEEATEQSSAEEESMDAEVGSPRGEELTHRC